MYKYVKQNGLKDCGIYSLYNILKYYGGDISIEKLRTMTNTNNNGTSMYDIVKTSNKLGFKTDAYSCEFDSLSKINLPAISYMKINNYYHYVILKKVNDNNIYFFDPIRGNIKYSREQFLNEWQKIVITFQKNKPLTNIKITNYLFTYIKKYSYKILLLLFFIIVSTIISIVSNFYFKYLLDFKNIKIKIVYIFLVILILKNILSFIKENSILNFNNNINKDITFDVYKKIFNLPLKYHHDNPTGDIISKINDLHYVKELIYEFSFNFIINFILFLIIILYFVIINKILFFSIVVFLCSVTFLHFILRNKINLFMKKDIENNSFININLVDNLMNIDTIKNLNIEDYIIYKNKAIFNKYLSNNVKLKKYLNIYNFFNDFLINFGNILILYLLIKSESISNIILINSLYFLLFDSLKNMFNLDNLLLMSKNSYKRINDLLNYENEDGKIKIKNIEKIEFENVCYSYNSKDYILNNLNLIINNKNILIKGNSGVGKSTIFKLLNKELLIDKGNIKINNINYNDISNISLKKHITYINQNEKLFNDSIKNNIVLDKKVTKEELEKVISVCLINKFIKEKNTSLEYNIEENGMNISGGERQKIILARSLLRESKYLILDETMNEIDIDSERIIIKNIKTEYKKVIILITHRTSNKDLFDEIIKVEGGKCEKT